MKAVEYKRLAIILAVIVCSTILWWTAHVWLYQPEPFTDWVAMVPPGIALVLFAAVGGMALMLLNRWIERVALILGSWATFALFWSGNEYYLSALPVFALFWFLGFYYIKQDLADRHTVRIQATLGAGVKFVLFAAFLMVSLGFYFTPYAQQIDITSISKGVQTQVNSNLTLYIDQVVRMWLKPIARWIPPLLALVLFLALWSISFIFRELAIQLGALLFWLLRLTGFVRVEKKQVESEVLAL